MTNHFTWHRFQAVVMKEFIQMRRDRLTFAMMVGVPIVQLILFGYAINMDPKHLPAAAIVMDHSEFSRSFMQALHNSQYFQMVAIATTEAEAERLIQQGEVQFLIHIPPDFSQRLQRGEGPAILLEADASDPSATSNALAALSHLAHFQHDLKGPLQGLQNRPDVIEVRLHRRYNAEGVTQYNIVPGLMGVILTMTLIMQTALAMTRERERGTLENLLATPVLPSEVMAGKILPYILVGYVQVSLILLAAHFLFHVPMVGSLPLLYAVTLVFIVANLAVGLTFSTMAKNQMQAMQMTFFFFLPSIILSGFMFPFRGMPDWAQWLGNLLPLTHFLRLVRGILLKGNDWVDCWPQVWPIALFLGVVVLLGLKRYRKTLD